MTMAIAVVSRACAAGLAPTRAMSLSLVLVAGTAVLDGRRQMYPADQADRLMAMLPPWQTGTQPYRLAL